MLTLTAAASFSASLQPTAFTILDNAGSDCLELIGRSRVRHEGHVPSFDSLERMLSAARTRHRNLGAQCNELEKPATAWCASELKSLKKQKLREKDKIEQVLALMRRHPRNAAAFQLGSGHYGSVLLGRSERHGRVAIKVGAHDDSLGAKSQLAREADVLRALNDETGFPKLLHHGTQEVLGTPSDVLVMELLGPSLEDLCWATAGGTKFETPLVMRLGREMLGLLQTLHGKGYVHNDLKPSNVLLGAAGSSDAQRLHLVDFGIATRAGEAQPASGSGISEPVGTPLFASAAAHAGRPTRAVDDLESLCYCLSFLASGRLPWQRDGETGALMKTQLLTTDGDALCEGMSVDECAAPDDLDAGDALQGLWSEVAKCNSSPDRELDYDACAEALGAGDASAAADDEPLPFEWAEGAMASAAQRGAWTS